MNNISKYYDRKKKIGARIKEERKRLEINQEELASRVSKILNGGTVEAETISQSTVSIWEAGKVMPPIDKMVCLAEIFECDVGYLLCDYDLHSRDSVDVATLTGLSGKASSNLVALHQWNYYLAPFRLSVISNILESNLFSEILAQLEKAYLTLCGVETDLGSEHDSAKVQEAVDLLNYVNSGNWTKYILYGGKDSAELQIQNASGKIQLLFKQIIDLEVTRKKKSDIFTEER